MIRETGASTVIRLLRGGLYSLERTPFPFCMSKVAKKCLTGPSADAIEPVYGLKLTIRAAFELLESKLIERSTTELQTRHQTDVTPLLCINCTMSTTGGKQKGVKSFIQIISNEH